jgi:prepilin-type N-terminal cleavage/methylation domain-containing protein
MRKGFTLIEVLVVAVIVAILAAVAIPAYNAYIRGSKEKVALNFAATCAQSAAAYYSATQLKPADLAAINVTAPSGYTAVIGATYITANGNGSTGYVPSTDLAAQSARWKR